MLETNIKRTKSSKFANKANSDYKGLAINQTLATMLSPELLTLNSPLAEHNVLETLNFKIYESLPKMLPYIPNPLFLNHIARPYQTIAWHSDFRVQFPHSLQYRMLRAITTGDLQQVTTLLRDHRFQIDDPIDKKYGLNSLQYASLINQYTAIQLLLMYGANINKKDQYGNTPLNFAVDRHNLESINSLMKNGCNRFEKNNYGLDAIEKAKTKPNQSYLVEFLQNYPTTSRRYPKFKVKLDFQNKINHSFWNYVKNYKIFDTKPKLFPFNNFKGTYRIDFSPFQTVEQIIKIKKEKESLGKQVKNNNKK